MVTQTRAAARRAALAQTPMFTVALRPVPSTAPPPSISASPFPVSVPALSVAAPPLPVAVPPLPVASPPPPLTTPTLPATAPPLPVKRRGRRKVAQTQPMKGGWVLPHGMGVAIDNGAASGSDGILSHQEKVSATYMEVVSGQADHPTEKEDTSVRTGQTLYKVDDISTHNENNSIEQVDDSAIQKEDTPGNQTNTTVERESAILEEVTQIKDSGQIEDVAQNEDVTQIEGGSAFTEQGAFTVDQEHVVVKEETVTNKRARRPRANGAKPSRSAAEIAAEVQDPNYRMNIKKQDNLYSLTPGYSPYPYRSAPTREDCYEVYRILAEMHGECMAPTKMPAASLEVAGCGEVPCVLDALLRTLVSGNTTMERANQAIQGLVAHYGLRKQGTGKGSIDWEKVRVSSEAELINAIRTAGSAPKRSGFIKGILDAVYEENLVSAKAEATATGKPVDMSNLLTLDHMHQMTKDEAMAKFISYKGIGIKTAACVILFCLQKPCFAVDTHVWRFCGWLGWTPEKADPDNCYRHVDFMVPDELKYGLHQLFIRHGQLCFKCRAITKPGTKDWNEAADCPLEHLLTRNKTMAVTTKTMAVSTKVTKRKFEEVDDEKMTDGESEEEVSEYEEKPKKKAKKARKPPTKANKARRPPVKAKKDNLKEEERDVQGKADVDAEMDDVEEEETTVETESE